MENFKIAIPEKVNRIINTLTAGGFEAYAVGGCVRDAMLGRQPEDWDITTSAMPDQVKKLFHRTVDTGIQHGTVTVLLDRDTFEVTTYRIDGEYKDARHPEDVTFTRSLEEDLLRRDFTINAMAYNESGGLIDIFGGQQDLKQQVIRCVGSPHERFGEDALRILRGLRFSAQLGFEIEPATEAAMLELAPNLRLISAERIQTELVKLVVSDHPDYLRKGYKMGITSVIMPEFDRLMETRQETPHHMYTVGEHTLHAMLNVRPDKVLRLTMLFHDMGKPDLKTMDGSGVAHFKKHAGRSKEIAAVIMHRLKFDNDTLDKVTKLVLYHDWRMPATGRNVRRAVNKIGKELFPLYLETRRADMRAQSMYHREDKMQEIDDIEAVYRQILEDDDCTSIKELALSGRDLIAAGMQPGPAIGEMLQALLDLVIEDPEMNRREILLTECEKMREKE